MRSTVEDCWAARDALAALERLIDELDDVEPLAADEEALDDELLLELLELELLDPPDVAASNSVDNIPSEAVVIIIIKLINFNILPFINSPFLI